MKDIPVPGDTCEGEEFGLKAVGCALLGWNSDQSKAGVQAAGPE